MKKSLEKKVKSGTSKRFSEGPWVQANLSVKVRRSLEMLFLTESNIHLSLFSLG